MSDRIALVITGGVVGVVALRLSSGLFIRLLQRYRAEAAGYLAVGLVESNSACGCFAPIWNSGMGVTGVGGIALCVGILSSTTPRRKRFSHEHGR